MTIAKYDHIAIFPKRCFYCGRLFCFESYNVNEITADINEIKLIKCKVCLDKEEEERGRV